MPLSNQSRKDADPKVFRKSGQFGSSSSEKFFPRMPYNMNPSRFRGGPYSNRSSLNSCSGLASFYDPSRNVAAASTFDSAEGGNAVTLQICNLDSSIEESNLRHFLLSQLKPITPVLSLVMESSSMAKLKVPSQQYAKLVIANLHRRKIGHKRVVVSNLRDPSSAEITALKCQVVGLLNEIPSLALPVYKFRELFQSKFKTSVCLLDLYRMPEVCTISVDKNEEKFISLNPNLPQSAFPRNPLIDSSQHSVPYCVDHFKHEKSKGWAEQDVERLPNVFMSIPQVQAIIYPLLKVHKADIPIATLLYCLDKEMNVKVTPNPNGIPLEHLVCCVPGIEIRNNIFGVKVLRWCKAESSGESCDFSDTASTHSGGPGGRFYRNPSSDPLGLISREIMELIKMNPKCTMKFNRFIPSYHNHFGKQCRVADYGYTRLIELFEALPHIVQVMGDGENRQITLTHQMQIRRFSLDLSKVLRLQKSILLSQLPELFTNVLHHNFDITDYGVCSISDMLNGLVCNNSIVIQSVNNGTNVSISMMKRKQTPREVEKLVVFASEVLELFKRAPQYSISFKKFVRSYHYHFGYQCKLSDYGFTKLAELLEAVTGILSMESSAYDEDRKINLSNRAAMRVFSEQLQELIKHFYLNNTTMVRLNEVLELHKNKYGYQIHPYTLGFPSIMEAVTNLPYTEVFDRYGEAWLVCHLKDPHFRMRSYASVYLIASTGSNNMMLYSFINTFSKTFYDFPSEKLISHMKHALQVSVMGDSKIISLHPVMEIIVKIVNVLENRRSVTIGQLQQLLGISHTTIFELGYPSLTSLIQAHSDNFVVVAEDELVSENSEISLKLDCVLTKNGFNMYIQQHKSPSQNFPPSCQNMPPLAQPSESQSSSGFWSKKSASDSQSSLDWENLFRLPSVEKSIECISPLIKYSQKYEPPKPDTPPPRLVELLRFPNVSELVFQNLSLQNDAAWGGCCPNDSFMGAHSLNIHIPELKTINIISSPLSRTQGVANFRLPSVPSQFDFDENNNFL